MSRQLILFRHASAEWDGTLSRDHDRELTESGRSDAALMGKMLANSKQTPQYAVTSSALRARTTIEIAAKAGHWNCPIRITEDLYNIQPDNVFEVVTEIPPFYHTAMLVGHEPTWSSLVRLFVGGSQFTMPTAGMACIKFESDLWNDVYYGVGTLAWFVHPGFFHAFASDKQVLPDRDTIAE